MVLDSEILKIFFYSLGLSASGVLFWLYFWYHYSKKFTTPRWLLFKAGVFGVFAAIAAALLEKLVIGNIFSQDVFFLFEGKMPFTALQNFLMMFGTAVFLTALPEEILKFFILRFSFFKSDHFNQIIDGIKFGLMIGLGFAFVENWYFFFTKMRNLQFGQENLFLLFFFRFFITTLAHSLYGAIMGYYFGLARSYKIFKTIFLWQGFVAVVGFHAFFNFLALTPLNILSFVILIGILIFAMKWYTDRKNLQVAISLRLDEKTKTPIFSGQKEMQALIAEGTNSNFRLVEKIGLCPYCFKRLKDKNGQCHYCGRRINPVRDPSLNGVKPVSADVDKKIDLDEKK